MDSIENSEINLFQEDVSFEILHEPEIKDWITQVILGENYQLSELNYIFCSDEYLHKMNVQYLDHDTYTDVITFDNSDGEEMVEGDIFISVDRIEENRQEFNVSFQEELHRVMIHGVLHLLGNGDKTEEEAQKMRILEQDKLSKRLFI